MDPVNAPRPLERARFPAGWCGKKVDALSRVEEELRNVDRELAEEVEKETHPTTGVAFVTFTSDLTAKRMIQNFHFRHRPTRIDGPAEPVYTSSTTRFGHKILTADEAGVSLVRRIWRYLRPHVPVPRSPGSSRSRESTETTPMRLPATKWEVRPAPRPPDIIWDHLGIHRRAKVLRRITTGIAIFFLVFFWSTPLAFLGSISNLTTLPVVGPMFALVYKLPPMVVDFITAYLPTLLVVIFNAILPYILIAFAYFEGMSTWSSIYYKVMNVYFIFNFVATLLLPTIAIGSFDTFTMVVESLFEKPFYYFLELLTRITAPASGFFIAYLIQLTFIGCAVYRLRLGALFIYRALKLAAVTPADHEEAEKSAIYPFEFHLHYPFLLLGLTISMFFAITIPLTTIFGLAYFVVKHTSDRYMFAYVHPRSPDESTGKYFAATLTSALVITAGFQFATAGMFAGKGLLTHFAVCIAAFFVTVWYYYHVLRHVRNIFEEDIWIPECTLVGTHCPAPSSEEAERDWHQRQLRRESSLSSEPEERAMREEEMQFEIPPAREEDLEGEAPWTERDAYVHPALKWQSAQLMVSRSTGNLPILEVGDTKEAGQGLFPARGPTTAETSARESELLTRLQNRELIASPNATMRGSGYRMLKGWKTP